MILEEIQINFPIIKFTSNVVHFTPRKPTVLESTIMKIVKQFGKDSQFNQTPLKDIFEHILCVADTDVFLIPALEDLVGAHVLNCTQTFSNLSSVLISDLSITKEGDEMLQRGMLPGRPQSEQLAHYYNPFENRILKKKEERFLLKGKGDNFVSEELYIDLYPESLILDIIRKNGAPWLNEQSELRSAQRESVKILWMSLKGKILLSENRELSLEFKKKEYNSYFSSLPGDVLFEKHLQPLLGDKSVLELKPFSQEGDFHSVIQSANGIFPMNMIPEKLSISKKQVHFLRYWPECENFVKNTKQDLLVYFSHPSPPSNDFIDWNEEGRGAVAYLPDQIFDNDCLYLSSNGSNVYANQLETSINGQRYSLPLGYSFEKEKMQSSAQEILDILEAHVDLSERLEDRLIKCFWKPYKVVWGEVLEEVHKQDLTFDDMIETISNLLERMSRMTGKKHWDLREAGVKTLLILRINQLDSPLDLETVKLILTILKDDHIRKPGFIKEIAETVLDNIQPPTSLKDLETTLKLFAEIPGTDSLMYPSKIYSNDRLLDFMNDFPDESIQSYLHKRNEFERAIGSLKRIETDLKRLLEKESLLSYDSQLDFRESAKSKDLNQIYKCCEKWMEAWCNLEEVLHEKSILEVRTPLLQIHENILSYSDFLKMFANQIPVHYSKVYVIDTNAFINRPDILTQFSNDDFILLSAKVIDELDTLKNKESTKENAEKAIYNLNKYEKKNLYFEHSDSGLLPEDYGRSPDNLILSVALKYKLSKPILVTADNGLKLKAKAEGIKVSGLSEFLQAKEKEVLMAWQRRKGKKRSGGAKK